MIIRIALGAFFVLTLVAISLVQADSATEPATEPTTQQTFTADQRDALIAAEGKDVTVTGTVSEIRDLTDRVLKISFAEAGSRDGFCGIVLADRAPAAHTYFDTGDGSKLAHKKISLSGKVSLYRGNPEIIISDISQVSVLDDTTELSTQP
jgi:hypothetical protein